MTVQQKVALPDQATKTGVKEFIQKHFRHFNAAVVVDAAEAYLSHLESGGKMLFTMAGAMSTAELGVSLAEMIRQNKIHAICCTGANLEEDLFNLVAHNEYKRVPNYRYMRKSDEQELMNEGVSRVTDTCIPEEAAMRVIERRMIKVWQQADQEGKSYFPYEYMFQLMSDPSLQALYQIDTKDSWLIAAMEAKIPIFTPGWEDSTMGNSFAACVVNGKVKTSTTMKSGIDQMVSLIDWYKKTTAQHSIGFFQIGGGIAGDFPICVVPLIERDLYEEVRYWGYFCQISDSTTSYGSYSGATPNEKISWGKLTVDTPAFVIESDATIVAPLVFAYILGL